MKLAEALQERADVNRRIEQLRVRLTNNALVQEGEEPAEDPAALKRELDGCISRLAFLMGRINLTNSQTVVEGKTLTEWLAQKDTLTLKLSAYRDLADAASGGARRARQSEIRILPAVSVRDLQKEADGLAKALRLVDNLLQEQNWKCELL